MTATVDQRSANRTFASLTDSMGMDARTAERVSAHLVSTGMDAHAAWVAMDAYLTALAARQAAEAEATGRRDVWACFRHTSAAITAHRGQRVPA